MSPNSWFQHSFYRDSTTATHCCLVCQGQSFSSCSMWWMQRLKSSWTCRCTTMWNQLWSSYIGCQLSKALYTSCVCLCITSTLDKHHSTCQAVYPQFLHYVADTGWGRLAQRITFCQEQELDLENEVSATVAQPPGTLFLPTSMTLLTPVHSENDSRVYFLIGLTTDYCWRCWTCCIAVSYKFHVDWFDWLIFILLSFCFWWWMKILAGSLAYVIFFQFY